MYTEDNLLVPTYVCMLTVLIIFQIFLVNEMFPLCFCLQSLPPAVFILMKSTEPHSDEYYLMDLDGAMKEIGFINVTSVLTDPRHRTVTGTVPLK
jgi:hypothetical protein